jgi:hypothetical protein
MKTRFVRVVMGMLCGVLLGGPSVSGGLSAQVIPIKTVPVATGDQFLIFPSDRLGMASVSIALQDTLGDPFSNPAALARLGTARVFGSPTAYSITDGHGGAFTLPVGALFGSSAWRGGVAMALQDLDRGADERVFPVFADVSILPPSPDELSQKSRTNLYGYGSVARTLGESGRTSIGVSVSLADLSAMSGVDLLYSRRTVDQRGSLVDLRLGLETGWGEGDVLEAVLLRSRFDMAHDLVDVVWAQIEQEGVPQEEWPWGPHVVETTENDETDTWALHLEYSRPLEGEGWRLGGLFTANLKSHPKIPNYTLMSIPRDPGNTWAYDLGIGVSKQTANAVFGMDLIYEPVRTQTWADAAEPVVSAGGDTIPVGDMTVFNDFHFNNAVLRAGLQGRSDRIDVQFGLQMRRYAYTLDQTDFVQERRRRQREDWFEWTPTLALALKFQDFSIGYTGRITTGTGRPGVSTRVFPVADARTLSAGDFIPAPSSALTLQDATVHTHQVSVSIPLGR